MEAVRRVLLRCPCARALSGLAKLIPSPREKELPCVKWRFSWNSFLVVLIMRHRFSCSPAKLWGFVIFITRDEIRWRAAAFCVLDVSGETWISYRSSNGSMLVLTGRRVLAKSSGRWVRRFGYECRRSLAVTFYAQFFVFWLVNETFAVGSFCFRLPYLPEFCEERPAHKHPVFCLSLFQVVSYFPVPLFYVGQ